jgi:hypothetical protein
MWDIDVGPKVPMISSIPHLLKVVATSPFFSSENSPKSTINFCRATYAYVKGKIVMSSQKP